MNKSKALGSWFERRVVGKLLPLWPTTHRRKDNEPSWDIAGCPFPVEAKYRETFPAIRLQLMFALHGQRWAFVYGKRPAGRPLHVAWCFPEPFALELLKSWQKDQDTLDYECPKHPGELLW